MYFQYSALKKIENEFRTLILINNSFLCIILQNETLIINVSSKLIPVIYGKKRRLSN